MPYGLDPGSEGQRPSPIGAQQAGLGEYVGAVVDDAWASNPLPSLRRWWERRVADYGELGAVARNLDFAMPGMGATAERAFRDLGATDEQFMPRSPWLTKEQAQYRGQELGLKLDRAMSEETFNSIAAERRRQLGNDAVFERARANNGYGFGHAALSVLLEFAANAVDPLNAASAFVPFSRIPMIAARLERISAVGARRLAAGGLEGGLGNLAVEPFVALAAADENPNYGFNNALMTLAFGAALGGGLHWLGGRLVDRANRGATPPAPPRPSPRDILDASTRRDSAEGAGAISEAAASSAARTAPDVAQTTAAHIEALHPETRGALYETALRQAANDLSTDVAPIARLDPRWVSPPDPRAGPASAVWGRTWDVATIQRELAEQRSLLEDLAAKAAQDPGRRFKAPEGYVPSSPELQAAKAYVTPPKGAAEPKTLTQFVRKAGYIDAADPIAGDLRANDLKSVLRKGGLPADRLTEAAHEAGYYTERPTIEQLVADIAAEQSGPKRYADAQKGAAFALAQEGRAAHDKFLAQHPIGDPRHMAPADLAYFLSRDPIERRLIELDDLQARGVISEAQAHERAKLVSEQAAADEAAAFNEAASRGLRPEGFEKELEAARDQADTAPLTEGEHYAAADRSGLPQSSRGEIPGGAGRSEPAAGGQGGAPARADAQSPAAADPGAVSRAGDRAVEARAQGALTDPSYAGQFEAWIKRQGDWRADAHIDPRASALADQTIRDRSAITPEKDLADLEAAAARLLTDADKAELKAVSEPYDEAAKMAEAYAACRSGGA